MHVLKNNIKKVKSKRKSKVNWVGLVLEIKELFRDRKLFKGLMKKINRAMVVGNPAKFFYHLKIWKIRMKSGILNC